MTTEDITYRLSDLSFDEVSLCAEGVNGESKVVLFKSAMCKEHKLDKSGKCVNCGYKTMSKAVMGSYEERIKNIGDAIRSTYGSKDNYCWIRATSDKSVVYSMEDKSGVSRTYSVDYKIADGVISFGDPKEVQLVEAVVTAPTVAKSVLERAKLVTLLSKMNPSKHANGKFMSTGGKGSVGSIKRQKKKGMEDQNDDD